MTELDLGAIDEDRISLLSVSRARVSGDGEDAAIAFRDAGGREQAVLFSFENLSRTIVQLLAIQRTCGERRRAATPQETGESTGGDPLDRELLLPFPVVRWDVGSTRHENRFVLRLTSDNGLIWDFVMPDEARARLAEDLVRVGELADERKDQP